MSPHFPLLYFTASARYTYKLIFYFSLLYIHALLYTPMNCHRSPQSPSKAKKRKHSSSLILRCFAVEFYFFLNGIDISYRFGLLFFFFHKISNFTPPPPAATRYQAQRCQRHVCGLSCLPNSSSYCSKPPACSLCKGMRGSNMGEKCQ